MNVPNMTLRDWFAGMVLHGIVARDGAIDKDAPYDAGRAYVFANAMMLEREKHKEPENVVNDTTDTISKSLDDLRRALVDGSHQIECHDQ